MLKQIIDKIPVKPYYQDEDVVLYCGDVLQTLKQMPNDSVDMVITSPPYYCYSEDTEILTINGWKNINKIEVGELVLSVVPENLKLEYVRVVSKDKWFYNGKLVHFLNNHIDLMVTPNHRMLVYYRKPPQSVYLRQEYYKRSNKKTFFVEAEHIKKGYITPKTGFIWKGKRKKYFILSSLKTTYNKQEIFFPEKRIKMEDWLAFFGLWLAEGSVRGSNGGKRKLYEISLKQKKPKDDYIRNILKRLPFKFNEYTNKGNVVCFYIYNRQLWEYLKQFGNSHQKYIPQDIKNLSADLLKILLENYLFGDGCIRKQNTSKEQVSCYSVSKKLKDDIAEIALKIGKNVSIKGNHLVLLRRKTIKLFETKRWTQYCGYVVGIEVEKNYTLCVRRNGKIVFSGNSLRNYQAEGQIGLEPTFEEYLDKIIEVMKELKRVIKKTGSIWVNFGSSYSTGDEKNRVVIKEWYD